VFVVHYLDDQQWVIMELDICSFLMHPSLSLDLDPRR
jgi:hypothetical protein